MKLADKLCYPEISELVAWQNNAGQTSYEVRVSGGLTFRERLIIALASNPELFKYYYEISPPKSYGEVLTERADEIIKEMENK